jgi:hypothetical protein
MEQGNTNFDDKKDEIEMYLRKEKIGVLGVCEANIGAKNDNFHIDGYDVVIPDSGRESKIKMSRTARADLTYRVRKDLSKLEVPELWIEIGESRRMKTLIGVVYREFRRWKENPQKNSTGEERIRA